MSELGEKEPECCENCKWHKRDSYEEVWYCTNPESKKNGRYTSYRYHCEKHEVKDHGRR